MRIRCAGLTFGEPNAQNALIRDLRAAAPDQARTVVRATSLEARRALLWNNAPQFVQAFMGGDAVGGTVDPKAAGIRYGQAQPAAPFVQALDAMDAATFAVATALTPTSITKAYLFSKYPEFFIKWDSGAKSEAFVDKLLLDQTSGALDGRISGAEWVAAGRTDAFIDNLANWDHRDRLLLLERPLLYTSSNLGFYGKDLQYQHQYLTAHIQDVYEGSNRPR